MNILKHELKLYSKSTVVWIVSLIIVLIFFTSIYPAFKDSAEAMMKVLDSFPDGLKKALGLTTMDMSSALGFFGFLFNYIILIGGVQAMNLGLSVLSNEQRDKTADFLLAKPVKRIQIVHAKLLAVFVLVVVTNIIFSISAIISLKIVADADFSLKVLSLFLGSLFFTQLFFMSFGMLLSVFMDKLKTVVPVSLGAVFGFFIVNMLNESIEGTPLTILTPFAYFNAADIYTRMTYDSFWLMVNCLLVVLFTVGAYVKYIKKDIPSV